jgi:hypothetical protein
MDRLLRYYRQTYYSDLLAVTVAIVGIIIFLRTKPDRRLAVFAYYMGGYCFLTSLVWICRLVGKPIGKPLLVFITYADFIFTVFEFLILFFYVSKVFSGRKFRLLMPAFVIGALCIFLLSHFLEGVLTSHYLYILFLWQSICISIISINVLYTLMVIPPDFKLSQVPVFWICAGFAFFTISTLPYSSMLTFKANVKTLDVLFTVFNVFYALLFFGIIKAFLCRRSISN